MQRTVLAVMLALAAVAGSALAAPGNYKTPDEAAAFKPGPNLEVVQGNCSACHASDYIATQPPMKDKKKRKSSRSQRSDLDDCTSEALSGHCRDNSGPYRHNCAQLTIRNLQPNTPYLVLSSTFHPLGPENNVYFDLEWISTRNSNIEIYELPPANRNF